MFWRFGPFRNTRNLDKFYLGFRISRGKVRSVTLFSGKTAKFICIPLFFSRNTRFLWRKIYPSPLSLSAYTRFSREIWGSVSAYPCFSQEIWPSLSAYPCFSEEIWPSLSAYPRFSREIWPSLSAYLCFSRKKACLDGLGPARPARPARKTSQPG